MATWDAFLCEEGYQLLDEAKTYTDELSKDDPEEEPYKSLYHARELLLKVIEKLKKFIEEPDDSKELKFCQAALELKLGSNFIDTQELSTGEEHVSRCLDLLEKHQMDPEAVNIYQLALNQMGILWTGRMQYKKSLKLLLDAEALYKKFKHEVGGSPVAMDEYLQKPCDEDDKIDYNRECNFEDGYTHTLFYIAQVYGKLEEKDLSAIYVHLTLQRQLKSKDFSPLEWCLHAATLSQYYMTERDFTMSRHCLASAEVVHRQAEANLGETASSEDREKVVQAKADIQRCWAKYGLGLLEDSRDTLMSEVEQMDEDEGQDKDANKEKQDKENKKENGESGSDIAQTGDNNLVGAGTKLNGDENNQNENLEDELKLRAKQRFDLEVTTYEEIISDKHCQVFEDARPVFLTVQKWLNAAKEFYVLDGFCNDFVEITQDHSLAFKILAFFEQDLERQCKMHKRRVDMLSALAGELNPQHYLLVYRQLLFEIADTYSHMMDLKLAILESQGNPTPHAIQKINLLTKESIQYYQKYLDSLKGGKPDYPEEFPDMDVRAALVAMFCIGRLYSKYIVPDVRLRLAYMQKSMESYKFVVDYCKRNPSAVNKVKAECEICEEMVGLMPVKMEKLRQENDI